MRVSGKAGGARSRLSEGRDASDADPALKPARDAPGERGEPRILRTVRSGVNPVLFLAFGGVLVLMALASLDFLRGLNHIENRDAGLTRIYLRRHRLLDEIRSSLDRSSALARDYVLESDPGAARKAADRLRELRAEAISAVRAYSDSAGPGQDNLPSGLSAESSAYWSALDPILQWSAEKRCREGYRYLQTQVLPRHSSAIAMLDRVNSANSRLLANGGWRDAELFAGLRRRVIGILGVALGAGSILAAASILYILKMEKEGRLRYGEIRRTQEELARLSASLVEAQEQERRAISRELHDQVGQSLHALRVDLGNLAAITPPENKEAHRFLNTARGLADESVKSLRNMALLLRPSMLDDLGLVAALGWQAREVSRRTGIRVDLAASDVPEEMPEEHKTCIYRVVQEALHNVSRHAAAQNVRIEVRYEQERLLLAIQDDGKGFDTGRVRGLGLIGMEERVRHLGGTFQVRSQPGKGTALDIAVPLPAQLTGGSAARV